MLDPALLYSICVLRYKTLYRTKPNSLFVGCLPIYPEHLVIARLALDRGLVTTPPRGRLLSSHLYATSKYHRTRRVAEIWQRLAPELKFPARVRSSGQCVAGIVYCGVHARKLWWGRGSSQPGMTLLPACTANCTHVSLTVQYLHYRRLRVRNRVHGLLTLLPPSRQYSLHAARQTQQGVTRQFIKWHPLVLLLRYAFQAHFCPSRSSVPPWLKGESCSVESVPFAKLPGAIRPTSEVSGPPRPRHVCARGTNSSNR
jgi:hypothetical protein